MTKAEAYEQYPNLKVLGTGDLIALLEGAHELFDAADSLASAAGYSDFAEAITAILKETKTEL